MDTRLSQVDKRNTRLEEQITRLKVQADRIECIDVELKQLRAEIASSPPGPSRRRLRLEWDALLAERELMGST